MAERTLADTLRLADTKPSETDPAQEINQAQWKRLERLDLLLTWDGSFGKKDLTEFFGISEQQASADISKYRELAPGNSRYDTKLKIHTVADSFSPYFVKPSADRYLDQLLALGEDIISKEQAWFREAPAFAVVPRFHPDVRNETLIKILKAIREHMALKVRYQPLSRKDASVRWIAPHALAFSGRRWHVRAYCFDSEDFRDFVLTRIVETTMFKDVELDGEKQSFSKLDSKWNRLIQVKLIPCHSLPDDQRRVIAKDYGMNISGKTVEVREALFLYFAEWHRLDPSRYGQIPDIEKMIEAENWDDIAPYMPPKPSQMGEVTLTE